MADDYDRSQWLRLRFIAVEKERATSPWPIGAIGSSFYNGRG